MQWVAWLCLFFVILFILPFLPMALEICCSAGDVTSHDVTTVSMTTVLPVECAKPNRTATLPPSYEEAIRLPAYIPHRPISEMSLHL